MLVLRQNSTMAADKSPLDDPSLPFGYFFDPEQGPPTEPPEPPFGEPLLSDTDKSYLSSFFKDIDTNQYDMPSYGEGLNFSNSWLDIPPQFMGSATSFGPQAGGSMESPPAAAGGGGGDQAFNSDPMNNFMMPMPSDQMMPPPPLPQQQQQQQQQGHVNMQALQFQPQQGQQPQMPQFQQHQRQVQPPLQFQQNQGQSSGMPQFRQHQHHPSQGHSDDVLHAAATLMHNNQSPHGLQPNTSPQAMAHRRRLAPAGAVPPGRHLRHQPLEDFQEEGRRGAAHDQQEPRLPDWIYPAQESTPSHNARAEAEFQWGSDSNFSTTQSYTPAAANVTVESMHSNQLRMLSALEVAGSAASTRPSSPSNGQQPRNALIMPQPSQSKGPDDPEAPPRKRRKSKINQETAEADDEDDGPGISAGLQNRRRKSKAAHTPPQMEANGTTSNGKKRRSTLSAGAKPARENLTEEQKRENHIRSEQKRRTLIKEGFDDLAQLVPGLSSRGYSKSGMLTAVGDWLEDFLIGNETLRNRLAALEASQAQ